LVTEKVPCLRRIKDIQSDATGVQEKDIGDGWTETFTGDNKGELVDIDMDEQKTVQVVQKEFDLDEEEAKEEQKQEELPDLDDMMDEPASNNIFAGGKFAGEDEDMNLDANIKKVRKYDLSITYDFYTRTPRLWLQGYGENGELLTKEEMYEDIMGDYTDKTVTMEEHPKIAQ
jgi:ubiquitin-like-conjugating enzyme ATG3